MKLCSIENPNNLSGFSSVVINEGSASSTSFAFRGHGLSLLRKHKSLSCGVFDSCCSRRSLRMLSTLFVFHFLQSILLFVFSVGSYSFVPASFRCESFCESLNEYFISLPFLHGAMRLVHPSLHVPAGHGRSVFLP